MKLLASCALWLGVLATAHAADPLAETYPRLLHGGAELAARGPAGLLGETLEVTGDLAQIALAPDLALALGAGARLAILRPDGAAGRFVVVVLSEPVLAVHAGRDRLAALAIGSHLLSAGTAGTEGEWALPLALPDGRAAQGLASKGMQLGDWVMVRQQAYIDSLRIDVLPLNHAIARFIRRLLPSGAR